jgi:hypothetical protein
MAKKITSLDEAPVDVIEALKRGFIHRGFIPRKYRRNNPLDPKFDPNNAAAQPQPKKDSESKSKTQQINQSDKQESDESTKSPEKQAAHDPLSNQPDDQHNLSEKDGQSNDSDSGYQEKPIYKHDDNKKGQIKTKSKKPDEKIGKRKKGFQIVEPQDSSGEHNQQTVEDEQRKEKPEGGEGGVAKDWPPQNLRNEITSTDPDISVIDSETGSQEAAKDPNEPEPGRIHEKLIDITEKAHDTLFEAETVFPFTLFPDTITLDREKLTIANRSFFRVAKIITVPITSMISAEADVGPFFGSVRMTSKYFIDNTHEVNFLWRSDATSIHRLLQGFIIAHERDLELHEIDKEDLKILLEDLGQGVKD